MEAKHTPGPWNIWQGEDGAVIEAGGTIASVPIDLQDWEANAALIARAPDLFAENERLRAVNAELVAALKVQEARVTVGAENPFGHACNWCHECSQRVVTMRRAALARAEKGTQL